MRAAFAVLFSLLLGLAQTTLPVSAAPAKRICSHCACPAGQSCCYEQGGRGSLPSAPLAPVRQLSSEQIQLLAHSATALFTSPLSLREGLPFATTQIPPATAVPLYHRNCTLLI